MQALNAFWYRGFMAVPMLELCAKQEWFQELNNKKSVEISDVTDQYPVSNAAQWQQLLGLLDVLGLLNRENATRIAATAPISTMNLSELYRQRDSETPLDKIELLKLSQGIADLDELEGELKSVVTGAVLVLALTMIREATAETFFSVLQSCSAAARTRILNLLAEHALIGDDEAALSALGQDYLQHPAIEQATQLKALLAQLPSWVAGEERAFLDSAKRQTLGSQTDFSDKFNAFLAHFYHADLSAQGDSVIVFESQTDPALASTLLTELSALQAQAKPTNTINLTCAVEAHINQSDDTAEAMHKKLQQVMTQNNYPVLPACEDKPKTIIIDACSNGVVPTRDDCDSEDLKLHATENNTRYFDLAGTPFEYKNLLSTWKNRFDTWANVLTADDSLLMVSRHNLDWEAVTTTPCGTKHLWHEAMAYLTSSLQISAESQLVLAGNAGLFSNAPVTMLPEGGVLCTGTVYCLKKRDYIIRHPVATDIDRLVELEELCWKHSQISRAQLLRRVVDNPRGQFVLEKAGKVLGVVYSQRIKEVQQIYRCQAHNVHELHDPSGEVVQLLAINVDPQWQSYGYGDQLLEFILQVGSVMNGVKRLVGVTLCKKYAGDIPFEQYITQRDHEQDPVLAFHRDHGAEVVGAVDNYRPEDAENDHKGVLVSYNIHTRQRLQSAVVHSQDSASGTIPSMSYQAGCELLSGFVQELLLDPDEFMFARPVMEMGLDSAELLQLQRQLEASFETQFQPGFFFQYSTCEKVMGYLTEQGYVLDQAGASPSSPSEQPVQQEVATEDDIAIVGMACKLPGGIESPQQLWHALLARQSQIGRFPLRRGEWPDSVPELSLGGFVEGAEEFDAEFFRIMPTEAKRMDPQQRMLLQLAWKCLEDAGIQPSKLAGTDTGVFVGASNGDYSNLSRTLGTDVAAHTASGGALAVTANRLSYFLDISGPSMLIDTACSASLVAVHQACQAIKQSECSMALVGGANLICFPELSESYHKAGMLSKEGKCKVFDQSADGYVRSEGAAVVLLMPLALAQQHNYDIKAVIKGSAVNHGGLSGGLTVPSPTKQGELIATAWQRAGVQADDVGYIEAHGTGTSLGDPIEIQGIQAALEKRSVTGEKNQVTLIGSVKSNLGHLESAAGITGLIKAALCIKHGYIPASINFNTLNEKIDLQKGKLEVVQEAQAWPTRGDAQKVAAVSSFGSGGANAHVVVGEWQGPMAQPVNDANGLFLLSAMQPSQLQDYAKQLVQWIEEESVHHPYANFIYTMQCGKTHMRERLAIVADDFTDLKHKLQRWLTGADQARGPWYRGCVTQTGGRDELSSAQRSDPALLAQDWSQGVVNNVDGLYREPLKTLSLPTYPFKRTPYWIERQSSHPLLGVKRIEGDVSHSTKQWDCLPQEYIFKQAAFSCLSLNLIFDMLLAAAQSHLSATSNVQIKDLQFSPLCVNPLQSLTMHTECTYHDNQIAVSIWQDNQSNTQPIAQAVLVETAMAQAHHERDGHRTLLDLHKVNVQGGGDNGSTVFDMLLPTLLCDTSAQVNIKRMFMFEGYGEQPLSYWHFFDDQIALLSDTKEIVCSITR
ncbi:hypothetical protein A7985_22730 [Pseudoalteromonas luteoviolacea]|uniref:Uncharacterized protein n=1 Tax=Pseudoalteromonas luteoviolacea TaxID=43657 RepID=A0A1C0TJX6_9GAMM|nr:beta-ketoacyl synthase N-terminal-like domain-containing protein [Pseudoalteromonas luteoviolacea]OCQ18834.1 hypothetical protein A7985_22730 [Pseudoalteromonas luteoviolacea]